MRHFASPSSARVGTSVGAWVRAISGVGALGAAFVLAAPGCQVITGSYTVESIGPVCTSLGTCCGFLPAAQITSCLSVVSSENETLCAELRVGLPANACMPQTGIDAGFSFPDAQSHDDGSLPPIDGSPHDDAVVQHDALGSQDGSKDSGNAASLLQGTWTLASVTCQGANLTSNGLTLTFNSDNVTEVETISDGCVETIDLGECAITSTTITSTSGGTECGSSCTSGDNCMAGSMGESVLSYTLSAGTLSISESVTTTQCSSGTIEFNFEMD